MDNQARVASLDRVQEFRSAYAKFGDAARQVLLGVDLEIRRMLDWLEKDQVAFWKGEIRRCEGKVNEAKAALHRKRITAAFGHTVGDTDEIVLLRKAQARLHAAEDKLKLVKQWQLVIEQEVNEYRGPAQMLGNVLDADVPRALGSLERSLTTLESYLQAAAPSAVETLGAEFTSAAMPPAGSEAAAQAAAATAAAKEGVDGAADDEAADTEGAT
jgi:hypothetical protein